MAFITKLMDWIDNLTLRERAAIFIAVIAVMFFIWDSYLMNDIKNSERNIKAQMQQKQAQRMVLNTELQELISERQQDPNAANRKKLEMLRAKLKQVKSEVLETTQRLVPPGKMARILENVLARTRGLDLVEVKGLGSSPLLKTEKKAGKSGGSGEEKAADTASGKPSKALTNAYKHGLRIVFNGSYMATLEYLRRLEELNSGFLWDSLELKVKDYPEAEAAITVYTLSLDDNWIGV